MFVTDTIILHLMGFKSFAVTKVPPPPLRNPFDARPKRNPSRFSFVIDYLLFVIVCDYIIARKVKNVKGLLHNVSHYLNTVYKILTSCE